MVVVWSVIGWRCIRKAVSRLYTLSHTGIQQKNNNDSAADIYLQKTMKKTKTKRTNKKTTKKSNKQQKRKKTNQKNKKQQKSLFE